MTARTHERKDEDAILGRVFDSPSAVTRESALATVMSRAVEVVDRILRRSRAARGLPAEDVADARASVLLRVMQRVAAGRDQDHAPIRSFDDFVAQAAYHAADDLLRARYPARARLKNRVRYIVTRDLRFTTAPSGHTIACGLTNWPPSAPAAELPSRRTATRTMVDAEHPDDAIHAILTAIGQPIALDELVNVVADLWQIARETDGPSLGSAAEPADDRPLHTEALESRQSLALLWHDLLELPPRQRMALLLHVRDEHRVSAIELLVLSGVAGFAAVAEAAGVSELQLEQLWDDLPLDDNRIAAMLATTRQKVIDLRRSARERLMRRRARRDG
jgi:hypothetical protein